MTLTSYGQRTITIDGDEIVLRDSLDGKVTLLTSIKKGQRNRNSLWIRYDRRPGVDPWIREPIDGLDKYSDDNFILYLRKKGIHVFGSITTYDDCLCFKNKMMSSPDMYLIFFKIDKGQWDKFKELFPEIGDYADVIIKSD
ncbi:MAG: hypothetical protein WKF87_04110 [Chryseolinea sp.]